MARVGIGVPEQTRIPTHLPGNNIVEDLPTSHLSSKRALFSDTSPAKRMSQSPKKSSMTNSGVNP